MAGSRIECPIYTVNVGGTRSDFMAKWLARRTLKPADQDRFLGGHLFYIIFSSFYFSFLMLNYFLQVV